PKFQGPKGPKHKGPKFQGKKGDWYGGNHYKWQDKNKSQEKVAKPAPKENNAFKNPRLGRVRHQIMELEPEALMKLKNMSREERREYVKKLMQSRRPGPEGHSSEE
ncbi:MAG: hypothetical protein AABZ60_17005, partial [Planctomycetota bacterium]